MSVLSFANVSYRYPGADADALREVTLSIEPGEFCVLAGLSGSGKSTVLRAAAGLAPHFHGGTFSGTVTVAGLDTREHGVARIGQVAGTLLQDPESQVIMSGVRAEVSMALENRGLTGAALARAIEETALALGIDQLLARHTAELSGGELQRVALAAALAPQPQLVLLDEPTSQLDPVAGDELIWQLRRLNQESDTAVVLIEHRLERALAAADRVIALAGGRVVCDRDPAGFLEWAAVNERALLTPAARMFACAGLAPAPTGVKQARAALRRASLLDSPPEPRARRPGDVPRRRLPRPRRRGAESVLSMRGVWHELRDGPAILRGVDLDLAAGERVVIMGRNGAGKSTLLRHAAGVLEPTRGSVRRGARVALLLQNPGDYMLHERVDQEAGESALRAVGLGSLGERNPRDLSGGQRQRLALAIVLGDDAPLAAIALDEPTRGMDAASKRELARWLRARAQEGTAVMLATHDCEFAAEFAARVVLMAGGRIIADGPAGEVLSGGRYFATETARILDGAGAALLPEQGAAVIRGRIALRDGTVPAGNGVIVR